jgi:hypothetical protein
MARYRFPAFTKAPTPRYVVVWDLQWQLLECQRLEPATGLSGAMTAAIERFAAEGWDAEATPEYGFVFVRRETERRLLMLSRRDPETMRAQSFSAQTGVAALGTLLTPVAAAIAFIDPGLAKHKECSDVMSLANAGIQN